MTRIYVEPSALVLGAGPEWRTPESPDAGLRPSPGAADALDNLREAGHDVVLLLEPGLTMGSWILDAASTLELPTETSLPSRSDQASWLVTADPRRCEHRPPGVRTILLGPRRPPGPRRTTHCDVEARDLGAAVIEILARDAMT